MHININNTQLFFDVYGSKLKITKDSVIEKSSLIVLHGGHGFADHTLYVEFWSQFSNISQVIFIDQRGCGRSASSSPAEWNLRQWADDLHQFCSALNIEKPIIAGVSMGGHVMCELVSQHSDLPGGLIFCNTEARFSLDMICEKLKILGGIQPANACHEFYTNPNKSTFEEYVKYCIPYYAKNAYSKTELDRCKRIQMFFCIIVEKKCSNLITCLKLIKFNVPLYC
jgi:proline iminopeptidase